MGKASEHHNSYDVLIGLGNGWNVTRFGESYVSRATEHLVFVYGPSKGFKAWGALSSRSEEGALQNLSLSRVLHFNAFTEYGGTHGAVTAMAVVVPAPRNILTCRRRRESGAAPQTHRLRKL